MVDKAITNKLYSIDDLVASCNACGAYTLTLNPNDIKHYCNCGGILEVERWSKYYSDPEWQKSIELRK